MKLEPGHIAANPTSKLFWVTYGGAVLTFTLFADDTQAHTHIRARTHAERELGSGRTVADVSAKRQHSAAASMFSSLFHVFPITFKFYCYSSHVLPNTYCLTGTHSRKKKKTVTVFADV